jgi:hypothetical protein
LDFGAELREGEEERRDRCQETRQQAGKLNRAGAQGSHGFRYVDLGDGEPWRAGDGADISEYRHAAIVHTFHEASRTVDGHDSGNVALRQGDTHFESRAGAMAELVEDHHVAPFAPP